MPNIALAVPLAINIGSIKKIYAGLDRGLKGRLYFAHRYGVTD